jgi:hypothetical protein
VSSTEYRDIGACEEGLVDRTRGGGAIFKCLLLNIGTVGACEEGLVDRPRGGGAILSAFY